jgi:hypothetical protein
MFYEQVITTRSYDDRLDTISAVREVGISVCSGGILGLGEADEDRVGLIYELSKFVGISSVLVVTLLMRFPYLIACLNIPSLSRSTLLCLFLVRLLRKMRSGLMLFWSEHSC